MEPMHPNLETIVGQKLAASGQRVATAESCSGGLLAHRITNVSGSSAYFLGGVVAYSNEAKAELLNVSIDDIDQHGAVSETVARQMAQGARQCFGAEWGIGITGVAGPTGGTEEKPVGLVYIAVAGARETHVTCNHFSGTRESIKELTADKAFELLLEQLQ